MSISIAPSNGIEFTDVPPAMMPTLNVVFGVRRNLDVGDPRDRAAQRVDRIRHAERAVAVTARALVRDLVAIAADRAARDAESRAVDRDEVVDLALELVREEVPRAAQVAGPFLADVGDEVDRAVRLELAFSNARATASTTASPRQSSPMPGRRDVSPCRLTLTSVPSGNTVSRWPSISTVGPSPVPRRSAITLPTRSMRTFVRPSASRRRLYSAPRAASLNGGAGISQIDRCCEASRRCPP